MCYANLIRTGDLLMAEHNRRLLANFRVSPTAGMVLATVEGSGGALEPGVIAERLIVTSASVTSLIDTLEKRGLVQRRPHPDDRRKVLVELTDQGQDVLDRLLPGCHQTEREVLSVLTPEEQRRLLRLLTKVQRRATDIAAAPVPELNGPRQKPARLQRVRTGDGRRR